MSLTKSLSEIEEHLYGLAEQDWGDRIGKLRQGLDDPELRVVVFGEFNRGKSTLINALLGREVLPAGLVPTTGQLIILRHGDRSGVDGTRVHFLDGRVDAVPVGTLEACAGLNEQGKAREDVAKIEMKVCGCLLLDSGITLIDTPGLNDHEAQTERAKSAISEADLVLLVLDARALLTESERELAVDWLGRSLGKPVVPVVNFMNLLPENDRKTVRRRLDLWSRGAVREELGRAWFETNALGALNHALYSGPPTADHFEALHDGLTELKGKRRKSLQRRSRLGQLLAEVRVMRARNAEILNRLREDSARVEAERSERLDALRDLFRRFDANAKSRRDRISTFAEVRFKEGIDRLVATLRSLKRVQLEATASTKFQHRLTSAAAALDKQGDTVLEELARGSEIGDGRAQLQRAEPMTVRERMILKARVAVGELPMVEANIVAVGGGAAVGAAVGTFVIPIPVVGTLIGGVVGGLLGNFFGQEEPDYGAAYAVMVRKLWTDAEKRIRPIFTEQFDVRCSQLRNQLKAKLEALELIDSNSLDHESEQRENLEVLLGSCGNALESSICKLKK